MKRFLLAIAAMAISIGITGCSHQSNPTEVTVSSRQAPDFLKLPARLSQSLNKSVSVTQFITAAQGGTLQLHDTYAAAPDSHIVTLDIALEFKPGDLPYDASLSMSVDDVVFITTIDLTFGPHGLVFNNPAKLSVNATGLNAGSGTVVMKLYYVNDQNVWERMPASNAVYSAGTVNAHGKLSHFSQYAFGRIDE